jgi:hypothetical protein
MRSTIAGRKPGEGDPEWRQCIVDRVDHGGRGADRPALSDALVSADARPGYLDVPELDRRHLGGGGQQIVDERGCQRVSVVVVGEILEQRAADALDGAAGDLALDHVGVDHGTDVLADDVPRQFDVAGLHVHLAGAGVGCVGPMDHRLRREPCGRLQRGGGARSELRRLVVRPVGEVGERHALR